MVLSWNTIIIGLNELTLIFCSDRIMPLLKKYPEAVQFLQKSKDFVILVSSQDHQLDLSKLLHFKYPRPQLFSTHKRSFLPLLILS